MRWNRYFTVDTSFSGSDLGFVLLPTIVGIAESGERSLKATLLAFKVSRSCRAWSLSVALLFVVMIFN